jgi:hypothetical protein
LLPGLTVGLDSIPYELPQAVFRVNTLLDAHCSESSPSVIVNIDPRYTHVKYK